MNHKAPYYERETIAKMYKGAVVRVMADTYHNMIGHVVKFGMNDYEEIRVFVELCNGQTASYHWTHLEVL